MIHFKRFTIIIFNYVQFTSLMKLMLINILGIILIIINSTENIYGFNQIIVEFPFRN